MFHGNELWKMCFDVVAVFTDFLGAGAQGPILGLFPN